MRPGSTPDIVKVLVVSYPVLGLVYLTDRLGTLVEPVFFIVFSAMLLAEVFEPSTPIPTSPTWADRVEARSGTRTGPGGLPLDLRHGS